MEVKCFVTENKAAVFKAPVNYEYIFSTIDSFYSSEEFLNLPHYICISCLRALEVASAIILKPEQDFRLDEDEKKYKIWTIDIKTDDIQKTLQEEFERLCTNGRVFKLEDKYDVVLNFVKELYNLKNDTLVSLHEACYNETISKEAKEILRRVGEL